MIPINPSGDTTMEKARTYSHLATHVARVHRQQLFSSTLQESGAVVLRWGLVLMIFWFGVFKFTPTEAEGIRPLVGHSPVLGWLYLIGDVRAVSRVIGVIEIAIAALIALHPRWPRLSGIGSIGAVIMFLTTLSFLFTTPGMWARVDGLLVPSGGGSFLIKDLALLGAALWTAGDALASSARGFRQHRDAAA